jgi:hypothetical protein
MTPRLSVRARFERFPATLKGAFILRGEDPDPHQVVLGEARIVPVTGGPGRPIAIATSTLDVAPRTDVFVPFESGVGDLESGWYELECELEVDGVSGVYPGGRRFSVPWPRASTRRGAVPVKRTVDVDGVRVTVEQLECAADHTTLHVRTEPPTDLSVTMAADGAAVPLLDVTRDEQRGTVTVTSYPVLKSQRTLDIGVRIRRASGSLEVPLP